MPGRDAVSGCELADWFVSSQSYSTRFVSRLRLLSLTLASNFSLRLAAFTRSSGSSPGPRQPSCDAGIALSTGLCIPLLIRSGWRSLLGPSFTHTDFTSLTVRLLSLRSDRVGVVTFRIIELWAGWVPSIRRSRWCLWMSPPETHHHRWLMPWSWSSIVPTGCIYDASEDSLSFIRPPFP